jgi:Transposase DDE domain group 1
MTECNQSRFEFEACGRREVVGRFDGGTISSDGGAFLLRQTDKRLNLLARLAECFLDGRKQELVEHSVLEMLLQRIYGLAMGYEDINEHEQLRKDPVFGILAGSQELDEPLAGKSTLNRMELGTGTKDRYKKITYWKESVDELLVKLFIESHQTAPEQIVLDVDTTDLPLHGKQEGRFFHGYYDNYCYLPLYIFCGEQVLCARLREANHDASFGSLAEIQRIVLQLRAAWPAVNIILRGDSGFCRNELMNWCENNQVELCSGWRAISDCEKSLGRRCTKRRSSGKRPVSQRGCLASLNTRQRRQRRAAGIARGAWWRKRSTLRGKRIRVLW